MFCQSLFFLFFIFLSANAKLPEGSPCMSDGYPGVCRHWKTCFTLVIDHRDHNYPTLCSYKGSEPIICCTGCDLVEDVSKAVINPRGLFLWKTNQKSWNQCIDYFLKLPYEFKDNQKGTVDKIWNSTRGCFDISWGIVGAAGGHDARRAEYPHMALLGYGRTLTTAQYVCGGSLISERYILTAGHCISSAQLGRVKYAALGMLKRSDPEELWQRYRIQSITPHPQYRSPIKYHDIALLRTTRNVKFNINVMPACLPALHKELKDEEAQATGWGATGPNTGLADTLQVVKVYEFSESECSNQFRQHRHLRRGYDHDTQMCYGDDKRLGDTCRGDSGGPLQTFGQIMYTQRTIIGVTSYGPDCRDVGETGIYTRVLHYVPWIDSVVWQ